MFEKPDYYYNQSAVLPLKFSEDQHQILLITSRNQKRWTIPKGIVEENLTPKESAGKEAIEEAGIEGEIGSKSIGSYTYKKWGGICNVEVFPLNVTKEYNSWPEDYFRKRKWFSIKKAINKINNKQLKKIIKKYIKQNNTEV